MNSVQLLCYEQFSVPSSILLAVFASLLLLFATNNKVLLCLW